ncbi:MAG: BMP family ABC transporter substrate-binding protein [Pigmentiphaga sp.]|uniref:BMP family lipoprotein n=1 Tax=Pigmentiphaga sp. TaxID=1977564 RepID=UPI0029B5EAE6|nr:BMP family ABC transporter substrate-binding protein [Pigmentiphaga sp.]MDX3905472.1 BMP family ABC transporter substrate-binding protein [Pigmentiphaga sp.]
MRIKVLLFGSPGHGSFNLCGLAGAEIAQRAGQQVELIWIESAGPAIRAARLIDICHRGADLVIAYGSQGDYPVAMAAVRFPHIHFIVVQGSHLSENTAVYGVLQEQSAFLAGVLAAAESRTGGLGHLAGVKSEAALRTRAAYVDGAMRHAPGMGMMTSFCGSQDDEEVAFETCEAMAKRGVDVIFAPIEGGRPGAVRACRKFRLRQIGSILDWTENDPRLFLGSAVADAGRCIDAAIKDYLAGNVRFGERTLFGVERPEYVRLAMSPAVGAGARQAVDEWSHALARGEVVLSETYTGREFELSGLLSRL